MNIKVDLEKMKEIHGEKVIEVIYDNIDIIEKNINVMKKLKFDDIENIIIDNMGIPSEADKETFGTCND